VVLARGSANQEYSEDKGDWKVDTATLAGIEGTKPFRFLGSGTNNQQKNHSFHLPDEHEDLQW
jgi:predicted Abi (CAAX) family protease